MKRITSRHLLAISALLFASAVSADPGNGNGPPEFPVTVTNDEGNPVVVSGDVTAEVSGSVDVASVPSTLTDRLDLALDELEDLNDAVQATSQPRASYAETIRFDREPNDCSLCNPAPGFRPLSQPMWVSFITISTENDEGFFRFFSEPEQCCDAVDAALQFGHRDQLTSLITAPLPQALKISGFYFFCGNNAEDCEVAISLIGDVAQ